MIDIHLHLLGADDHGHGPQHIGTPFRDFGAHDPKENYHDVFEKALKENTWADKSVPSPGTNDSMKLLTLKALKDNNVYAVASGDYEKLRDWKKTNPHRIINSAYWNFGELRAGLTVDSLEKLFKSGEFKVFGEVAIQYEGFSASDSIFEPFLVMAERLDIPVGIHVGNGPPGAPYCGSANYRGKMHSALSLEDTLIRHPKLRVYAMHAEWPMLDDMLTVLYTHPQLHVDLAAIFYFVPTKEFYYYLERMVNAGFGKRIMFGSDNMMWPETIKIGIDNINNAPFLTAGQKRDILFNNAARFLRLSVAEINRMHEGVD